MIKEHISIPNGCCELVLQSNGEPKPNCFKVLRSVLDREPKKGVSINVLMGSGFTYNGEIYHKDINYAYFYIY